MKQEESRTNCIGHINQSATDEFLRARDTQGLPQSEVMRRVGGWDPKFSQVQFWRIQNGKAQWTLERFVLVAAALGLDPAMLLDRILRGHDIMEQLRARDGPDDASAEDAPGGDAGEDGGSGRAAGEELPAR